MMGPGRLISERTRKVKVVSMRRKTEDFSSDNVRRLMKTQMAHQLTTNQTLLLPNETTHQLHTQFENDLVPHI